MNRAAYDAIAARWDASRRIFAGDERRYLDTMLAAAPAGSTILDLGCGPGHGLLYAHQHFKPATLTGVDADPRQLVQARIQATRHQVPAQLHTADAANLPLPAASYDVVLSLGCLHHVPSWPKAVAECARILRHGGLLYLHEYYAPLLHNPFMHLLCPHPPHRFTHAQLLARGGLYASLAALQFSAEPSA